MNYVEDIQALRITIIDDTTKTELCTNKLLGQGLAGAKVSDQTLNDYQALIKQYLDKGYELVEPVELPTNYDNDPAKDQLVTLHLTHGTRTQAGASKGVTETITYVYGNGPKQGQPVSPVVVVTKTFVPLYTVDAVTGDIIETTWSGDGVIEASQVPEISGYTPDKTVIAERILTPTMENQSQTVYYMLDEKPAVDETPEPERPTETVDKEPGIGSDEKQEEQNEPPKQVTTTQTSSVDKEKTASIKEGQTVTELPQTGDAATEKTTFVGAMLATLAGLLGFATTKRKKEDK